MKTGDWNPLKVKVIRREFATVAFLLVFAFFGIVGGAVFIQIFLTEDAPKEVAGPAPEMADTTSSAEMTGSSSSAEAVIVPSAFARLPGCVSTAQNNIPVTLYVADTPQLRQRGLQGVRGLPSGHGMLFSYDSEQPASTSFWMYNTPIDLDIAFLDRQGTVQAIRRMQSCSGEPQSCPPYPAGTRFHGAVEFPSGFFRNNAITVGDQISVDLFMSCPQ